MGSIGQTVGRDTSVTASRRWQQRANRLLLTSGLPLIVLSLAVAATVALTTWQDGIRQQRNEERFAAAAADVVEVISTQVEHHSDVLAGLGALFAASEEVSPAELETYARTAGVTERVPTMGAMSFIPSVTGDELDQLIAWRRDQGLPSYDVRPPGRRTEHRPVLMTSSPDNADAVGLDALSVPGVGEVQDRATATGQSAISPQIELVRAPGQPAFVVMHPVTGVTVAGLDVDGWLSSPVVAQDFLDSALRTDRPMRVALHDGADASGAPMASWSPPAAGDGGAVIVETIDVLGHNWTVELTDLSPGGLEANLVAPALLVAGLLASVALAGALWALARARSREEERADVATADLRRTAADLEARNTALEQSNADLERFAYVASHDLQEPLRSISGYLQLIDRRYGGVLDDDGRQFIGFAVGGAQRLKEIIEDLLAYSRVGRAARPFRTEHLRTVVDEALRHTELALVDAGATVEVGDLSEVHGDVRQLVQVVTNLLTNCARYRHPDRPLQIDIASSCGPDGCELVVEDNGVGIAPEHRERVFGMFERLQTGDQRPGTGIGLSIVHRIVERHGGTVWIEESPAGGAGVHICLPVCGEDDTAGSDHVEELVTSAAGGREEVSSCPHP